MKKNFLVLLLLFLLITMTSCNKNTLIVKTYYLDNAFSIVPIVSILDDDCKFDNSNLQSELSNITNNLDEKFNVFNSQSLISKVNDNSGIKEVVVDEEFIYILNTAIGVSKRTIYEERALYDISIFSVWKEWKFNENYYQYYNYASPPSSEIINQKLPLVNFNNILINEKNNTVLLKEKGMSIDLGSIVKGYAADKIYEYLKNKNFSNFLIDVGGNILTSGKNIGTNKRWKVGIQMPFTYGEEIGYIEALDAKETFVTSGIYERYIVEKDKKTDEEVLHHHILNPCTGYPQNNELLSVTIIMNSSIEADAYSTAVFLLGLEQGYKFIEENNNISAIFITKEKEIILTSNISNRFILNEDAYLKGYKIINYNLL